MAEIEKVLFWMYGWCGIDAWVWMGRKRTLVSSWQRANSRSTLSHMAASYNGEEDIVPPNHKFDGVELCYEESWKMCRIYYLGEMFTSKELT